MPPATGRSITSSRRPGSAYAHRNPGRPGRQHRVAAGRHLGQRRAAGHRALDAHYSATEQTNLEPAQHGLSVGDTDNNGGVETVTLAVGEGILTVAAGDSGVTNITGNGTGSVTFSGTVAQINALLNASTGTVVYNDNTDTPSSSTTLTLTVHDNGNTGGGDLTATASATIDIRGGQ